MNITWPQKDWNFLYLFPGVWVFETPKCRPRKLRPLEINKEKRFKLDSILSPKMFYAHAMFIGDNSQKESLSSPFYRCRVRWIQNWLQFEQHYSDSVSSTSSVKNSPANAIKISAAIYSLLVFHCLIEETATNRRRQISRFFLAGCCLWTLCDYKTLGDKNWDDFTL